MPSSASDRPQTLLVITQAYVPDPAAAGQHLADVAEAMAAKGWRVVVYTACRGYDDPKVVYKRRERIRGVEIRRLPLSSFGKRSIAVRLVAQAIFMTQAMARGLFMRHLSLVLVSTNPSFVGVGGVFFRLVRGVPFVWWVMDLNPDQLIATGAIRKTSWPARVFDALNRLTLRFAGGVIALDRFMADRLRAKRDIHDRLVVVPPWSPAFDGSTSDKTPQDFRTAHGLANAFIISYSGNHALQHPLTTVLEAARHFEQDEELQFVFIGGGAGKAAVDARVKAGAPNIRSLPFQPLADIGASLGAADVHVVSMGDDMVGIVHPCKIYGVLAMRRPVLFLGPRNCHIGDIMTKHRCGEIVSHGDVEGAVRAIERLRALSRDDEAEIGDNCDALIRNAFDRPRTLAAVCEVLEAATSRQGG